MLDDFFDTPLDKEKHNDELIDLTKKTDFKSSKSKKLQRIDFQFVDIVDDITDIGSIVKNEIIDNKFSYLNVENKKEDFNELSKHVEIKQTANKEEKIDNKVCKVKKVQFSDEVTVQPLLESKTNEECLESQNNGTLSTKSLSLEIEGSTHITQEIKEDIHITDQMLSSTNGEVEDIAEKVTDQKSEIEDALVSVSFAPLIPEVDSCKKDDEAVTNRDLQDYFQQFQILEKRVFAGKLEPIRFNLKRSHILSHTKDALGLTAYDKWCINKREEKLDKIKREKEMKIKEEEEKRKLEKRKEIQRKELKEKTEDRYNQKRPSLTSCAVYKCRLLKYKDTARTPPPSYFNHTPWTN